MNPADIALPGLFCVRALPLLLAEGQSLSCGKLATTLSSTSQIKTWPSFGTARQLYTSELDLSGRSILAVHLKMKALRKVSKNMTCCLFLPSRVFSVGYVEILTVWQRMIWPPPATWKSVMHRHLEIAGPWDRYESAHLLFSPGLILLLSSFLFLSLSITLKLTPLNLPALCSCIPRVHCDI